MVLETSGTLQMLAKLAPEAEARPQGWLGGDDLWAGRVWCPAMALSVGIRVLQRNAALRYSMRSLTNAATTSTRPNAAAPVRGRVAMAQSAICATSIVCATSVPTISTTVSSRVQSFGLTSQ